MRFAWSICACRTPSIRASANLARTLTASATNNYDRAAAIQSYLRNNFQYTLDPPDIEPEDPVGSFLFRSKSGYCEYFAAAMAVMLRTLNVPSRLVNGFQTGSYNRIGKDFVVRARDAHSWVEVYFTGYGWIPFDPTPADPASRFFPANGTITLIPRRSSGTSGSSITTSATRCSWRGKWSRIRATSSRSFAAAPST